MIITTSKTKVKIVPNVEAIAREMTMTSQVGIIVNRVKRLKPRSLLMMGVHNIPYLLKIAKRDFAVGIKLVTELEILKLREGGGATDIALHQQMVDMAVALDNRKMIEYLFRMSTTYDFVPYLMTCNVGPLITFLSRIRNVPSHLRIMTDVLDSPEIREYLENSSLTFMQSKGVI